MTLVTFAVNLLQHCLKGFSEWNLRTQHHTSFKLRRQTAIQAVFTRVQWRSVHTLPLGCLSPRTRNGSLSSIAHAKTNLVLLFPWLCFIVSTKLQAACVFILQEECHLAALLAIQIAFSIQPLQQCVDSVSFIKDPYSEVPCAKITHSLKSIHARTQRDTNRISCRFVKTLNRLFLSHKKWPESHQVALFRDIMQLAYLYLCPDQCVTLDWSERRQFSTTAAWTAVPAARFIKMCSFP